MKICVFGLWHLGVVTSACLASSGQHVIGLDFNEEVVKNLKKGIPPLFEPNLEDLIKKGIAEKKLEFSTNIEQSVHDAQLIWVTYDTPVDENDCADVNFVIDRISQIFPYLKDGQNILVSSQLPAGSVAHLEKLFHRLYPDISVSFAYSPENLRLGKAISAFTKPERIIVGIRNESDKNIYAELLSSFTNHIEWMSVESAEMTKHALNAFLATSIVFINEIATICEKVGANAKEVERGLKTDIRVGQKAYLSPGSAFSGGTLARDINFLEQLGKQKDVQTQLISATKISNDIHKNWSLLRLSQLFGSLKGKTIAIWGLTYKPDTDTLRRSSSLELCKKLLEIGAQVQAHDPAIKNLPNEYNKVKLCLSPLDATKGADALVIATEWSVYRSVEIEKVISLMKTPYIIDINHFLDDALRIFPEIKYITIGMSK